MYCLIINDAQCSILRRCSNYIFVLDLTHGFNILHNDNCRTGCETFKLWWDLVWLILEVWGQVSKPRGWIFKSWYLSEAGKSTQQQYCAILQAHIHVSQLRDCLTKRQSGLTHWSRKLWALFKRIFLHTFFNVNCCALMKTSPSFVRSGPIDYNPLCGQIIGWDSSRWRANIWTNDGLVHPPSVPEIFEMVPVVALALVLPVR